MADEDAARPGSGLDACNRQGSEDAVEAPPSLGDGAPTAPASEVAELRAELAAAKDRELRGRAELENYKKRMAREKADALRFGSEPLLRDLLPVIDNLQRALAHARTSQDVEPIIQGVELVLRSLDETLVRHGVRVVEARGTTFDPSRHEAIGHVESPHPPNTVIDEHQRGYLLHDRLLRPALVTVGKGQPGGDGVEKAPIDG